MSTRSRQRTNTVPVGATPVSRYASWGEHRDALRHEADARRAAMQERLAVVA